MRKIKPITPHRSGWCLTLPVSKWSQEEHDKCPKTFPQGDCQCTCGHTGERTLESRGMSYSLFIPPKIKEVKIDEDTEDDE